MNTMREEWWNPSQVEHHMEQIKDLQTQIKMNQQEMSRKQKLLNQVKTQKDIANEESNQVQSAIGSMKEENAKLQRQLREA